MSDHSGKVDVELNQQELGQAIVQFAIAKAGLHGTISHSIKMNATIVSLGDGPLIVVSLEKINLTQGGSG